mmetsp:Transcript_20084/g.40544  ORF Transcript_20084/g.40544 Transcript_20084/m.40544 type:complete len:245 (-) Transcript_20084:956-1690(-)
MSFTLATGRSDRFARALTTSSQKSGSSRNKSSSSCKTKLWRMGSRSSQKSLLRRIRPTISCHWRRTTMMSCCQRRKYTPCQSFQSGNVSGGGGTTGARRKSPRRQKRKRCRFHDKKQSSFLTRLQSTCATHVRSPTAGEGSNVPARWRSINLCSHATLARGIRLPGITSVLNTESSTQCSSATRAATSPRTTASTTTSAIGATRCLHSRNTSRAPARRNALLGCRTPTTSPLCMEVPRASYNPS